MKNLFALFFMFYYSALFAQDMKTVNNPLSSKEDRIYTDEWITSPVMDKWGNPTGLERKLHIRITGPENVYKGLSSKFIIELEPSDPLKEFIYNFNIDLVANDGYLKCSPKANYKVSTTGTANFFPVTDMSQTQRSTYKWSAALSEITVNAIPVIGTMYSISENLNKTCNWLTAEENDWLAQWKYISNFDRFTIPKPICSLPTGYGRKYLIECPFEILGDEGTISFIVRDASVYPLSSQNGPLAEGAGFPIKTYTISGTETDPVYMQPLNALEEKHREISLNIKNHMVNFKVSYTVDQSGVLNLSVNPECKDEKDAVRLEDINLSLVFPKGKGNVNGLPVYYNYQGQEAKWETERQKLAADALLSWISMVYSPQTAIEKAILKGQKTGEILKMAKTVGMIWTIPANIGEIISFSDKQKQMWENETMQNTFHLPSFTNWVSVTEMPKGNEGFKIEVPISALDGKPENCFLLLSCKVNGKSYLKADKLIPTGQGWTDVIGLQISVSNMEEVKEHTSLIPGTVLINGGIFQMGSNEGRPDEKPIHIVKVNDFYMMKYEVTQKEWNEVIGKNVSHFNNCENCPVENVSWDGVQVYIRKLHEKTGIYWRLPTEAEWEYAAKGGQPYKYDGSNIIDEVAWYRGNSGKKTHPVGQKKSNSFGLYDMIGNVSEWCSDFYNLDYYKYGTLDNPQGPISGGFHVYRGGSWNDSIVSISSRQRQGSSISASWHGFRLVTTIEDKEEQIINWSKKSGIFIDQRDGEKYKWVKIGSQIWLAENLKSTKYINGDLITTTNPEWLNISGVNNPKYQWICRLSSGQVATYSRFYTWYAAIDKRNICPIGWHLPSQSEWVILENYLINNGFNYDGTKEGNKIAKALADSTRWWGSKNPGTPGNIDCSAYRNKSGFSALPDGDRNINGSGSVPGQNGRWWSSTQNSNSTAWLFELSNDISNSILRNDEGNKSNGYSVRCVKDKTKQDK